MLAHAGQLFHGMYRCPGGHSLQAQRCSWADVPDTLATCNNSWARAPCSLSLCLTTCLIECLASPTRMYSCAGSLTSTFLPVSCSYISAEVFCFLSLLLPPSLSWIDALWNCVQGTLPTSIKCSFHRHLQTRGTLGCILYDPCVYIMQWSGRLDHEPAAR